MSWTELLSLIAVLVTSTSAVLAWIAKLRWSSEYRNATDQAFKAKDAEIQSLRTHVETLQAIGSGKILEHATATKQSLETIIDEYRTDLDVARARIEELKIEIADLNSPSAPPTETTGTPTGGLETEEQEQALVGKLRTAEHHATLLLRKYLSMRVLALSREADRLPQLAAELGAARGRFDELKAGADERREAWLRDKQDAQTKLGTYRERAAELQAQIRQIRELGPEGTCPTCGCPVGDDYERLLDEMEDQLADVTQDGKWWRSRAEQLVSPEDLAEIEQRQAEITLEIDTLEDEFAKAKRAAETIKELQRQIEALDTGQPLETLS